MRRRDVLAGLGGLGVLGAAGCSTAASAGKTASGESAYDAAFFYAFPLYEMARLGQNRTTPPVGQFNHPTHRAVLLDHTSRQVTGPNNDTIYTTCQLELSGGPVEVFSPTSTSRYFSVAFMDAFTDNFAYIGTRATRGQGGRYWVAGPQWTGTAPAGVPVLRSSTNDVWMLARILVDGPDDLKAAAAFQRQIKVTPTFSTPAKPYAVRVTRIEDPANFLGVVNDMLARSPGGKGQTARASRFAPLGIGPRAAAPDLVAWGAYIPTGLAKLRHKFLFPGPGLKVNGWDYQPKGVGYFGTDDLLRSAVALGGIAAMTEQEAMYFHATTDASDAPLTGSHAYKWRLPPGGVPVDAFWSLTMYQAEDDGRYFLVDNPIRRYSIGDRTPGLVKNPDGSIDILIQHDAPTGPLAANWLPAPAGKMALSLRAYLPRKPLLDRDWHVPPLEQTA